jgi:hypothetical protein
MGIATSCPTKARQSLPVTRKRCPFRQRQTSTNFLRLQVSKLVVLDETPKISTKLYSIVILDYRVNFDEKQVSFNRRLF